MIISPGFHPGERRFESGTPYMYMKRGYELWGIGPDKYSVTLFQQPWRWWLQAEIYHRYDSIVWRVPGVKALERFLKWVHRNDEWYIPLTNQQDCRCYELSRKGRETLVSFEISKELYDKLK